MYHDTILSKICNSAYDTEHLIFLFRFNSRLIVKLVSSCKISILVFFFFFKSFSELTCGILQDQMQFPSVTWFLDGARCSSVVRAFAHGAMGRRIDPSWGGPIELFLVPASAPRVV